jgi:hypothetical protein
LTGLLGLNAGAEVNVPPQPETAAITTRVIEPKNDILDFREQATTCAQITAWTISGVGVKSVKSERVEGMLADSNFFQALGVQPLLGRAFNNDDDEDVIISYGLWQRQVGGDPNLIGQDVNLMDFGSGDRILIGVLTPEFDFPQRTEAWLRYNLERGRGGNHYL